MLDDRPLDRRQFLRIGALTTGAVAVSALLPALAEASPASSGHGDRPRDAGADIPLAWFALAQRLVRTTPGFSPPVAARAFGYLGVALYEAVVPATRGRRSLAGQLDGLTVAAVPHRDRRLHWPLVANSAVAGTARALFPAEAAGQADIDALEREVYAAEHRRIGRSVARRSWRAGAAVADAIITWSATDGGHEAYRRSFPTDYRLPVGDGLWQPTPPAFAQALLPTWGQNRTMLPSIVARNPGAPPHPFSTNPTSAFFAEAHEVYITVNNLTPEQRTIAAFWSDDPGVTATPPGHSVSITSQVLAQQQGTTLSRAAEAYARVGIALNDAFVCCWASKYRYNVLRPVSFIQAHIDPTWGTAQRPLPLVTPPFPEHTSGHSVQSAAAATVLTAMFGDVVFTDHTHAERQLEPRHFRSLHEAAAEAASSRLYGGIHYRRAIDEGLRQGGVIGDAVNRLCWSDRAVMP